MKFYHGMVEWFIDHFDTSSNVLLLMILTIYCDTLRQLAYYHFGNLIIQTIKLKKDNPDSFLVEKWKRNLGFKNKKEIPCQAPFGAMVDLSEGGDDFERYREYSLVRLV